MQAILATPTQNDGSLNQVISREDDHLRHVSFPYDCGAVAVLWTVSEHAYAFGGHKDHRRTNATVASETAWMCMCVCICAGSAPELQYQAHVWPLRGEKQSGFEDILSGGSVPSMYQTQMHVSQGVSRLLCETCACMKRFAYCLVLEAQ